MKKLKVLLLIVFGLHLTCLFFGNTSGLTFEENPKFANRLNGFGRITSVVAKNLKVSKPMQQLLFLYAIYSGTDRGFEFFSPNVSNGWVELSYVEDGRPVELPLKSKEAQNKFITANYYLQTYFRQPKLRDQMLTSISLRLFSLDTLVHKIDINVTGHFIRPLSSYSTKKQTTYQRSITAFVMTRSQD